MTTAQNRDGPLRGGLSVPPTAVDDPHGNLRIV